MLPNLSDLSVRIVEEISGAEEGGAGEESASRKRKDVERANYEFPEDGIKIRDVDWQLVRETIKMDARFKPADEAGYPSYRLTFYKKGIFGGHIAVNLHLLLSVLKMLNSRKDAACFHIGLPGSLVKTNVMYLGDLFYAASQYDYRCDMSPDYGETPESVDLLLNSVTTIASNLDCIIKLQDASKFKVRENMVILPVLDQEMTTTLRLKRGYGYYDARGFFPSLIDYAILDGMGKYNTDMPNNPDSFIKAFQINMDWIHLWTTTPLNALEPAVLAFANKVANDMTSPMIMRQLFATAKERFEDGPKLSLPYFIEGLDSIDVNLKTKSLRELVYEMEVPNALYSERVFIPYSTKVSERYKVFIHEVAGIMDRYLDLQVKIDGKTVELQPTRFTQRTFRLPNGDGMPSIFRMGVSVPPGGDGRPIVNLVEVDSDITVFGNKQTVMFS